MTDARADDRPRRSLAVLLVIGVALLAHVTSLGSGWIWDDDSYVTRNPILSPDVSWTDVFIPGRTPQYYPLVFLTFRLEHGLVGNAPFLYHLVNLALHAANATLLLLALRRLSIPHAAWIAALFAAHPMGVESVAWVTERKNVLSMAFALLSTIAFLRHRETQGRASAIWWATAFAAFIAALLSKTTAIFVPPCLVLSALWMRRPVDRPLVLAVAPFFAIGAALGLLTAHLEKVHVGATGAEFALGALERLQLAGRTSLFYAIRFVLPTEQVFIYPRFTIDVLDVVGWIPTLLGAVLIAGGAVGWRRGKGRGVLLATLWYGAALFPALGFFDVWPFRYSFVADHFAYAAMPVLALASIQLATSAARFVRAPTFARRACGGLAIVGCIALSTAAIPKYESKETLWRATAEANPEAWIAHGNLAREHLDRAEAALATGDAAGIARHAEAARISAARAVEIAPAEIVGLTNLSEALRLLGRADDALAAAERAVASAPQLAQPAWMRARLLETLGRADEARTSYRAAAEHPTDRTLEIDARRDLLRMAYARGDVDGAVVEAMRLLELDPADGVTRANLGALEAARGDAVRGRAILRDAVLGARRFPSDAEWSAAAARYLGLFIRSGEGDARDGDDARRVADRLVRLVPGDPGARFLALAVRDLLGEADARPAIESLEREARGAGAVEFADEVRRHLDSRAATSDG